MACACSSPNPAPRRAIVSINGEAIPNSATETPQTRQRLYELLCQMYDLRRSDAESYALTSIISRQPAAQGLSPAAFLDSVAEARLTTEAVDQTAWQDMVGQWMVTTGDDGSVVPVRANSPDGIVELRRRTLKRIRNAYIDSLFEAENVIIDIDVPQGPRREVGGMVTETLNPISAPRAVLTVVYDLECAHCRSLYPTIKEVAAQYGGVLRVNLVDASSPGSLLEKAAQVARAEADGATFADWALTSHVMQDSLALVAKLVEMGVDESAIPALLDSPQLAAECQARHDSIAAQNLASTPQVLLNSRLLWRGAEKKILLHEIGKATSQK